MRADSWRIIHHLQCNFEVYCLVTLQRQPITAACTYQAVAHTHMHIMTMIISILMRKSG